MGSIGTPQGRGADGCQRRGCVSRLSASFLGALKLPVLPGELVMGQGSDKQLLALAWAGAPLPLGHMLEDLRAQRLQGTSDCADTAGAVEGLPLQAASWPKNEVQG